MSPVLTTCSVREGAAPDTFPCGEEAAGLGVVAGVVRVLFAGVACGQIRLADHNPETNNGGSHSTLDLPVSLLEVMPEGFKTRMTV